VANSERLTIPTLEVGGIPKKYFKIANAIRLEMTPPASKSRSTLLMPKIKSNLLGFFDRNMLRKAKEKMNRVETGYIKSETTTSISALLYLLWERCV
jgi:hypothetical protein